MKKKKKTHLVTVAFTVDAAFRASDVRAYVRGALVNYKDDPLMLLGPQHVRLTRPPETAAKIAAKEIALDYGIDGNGPEDDARDLAELRRVILDAQAGKS